MNEIPQKHIAYPAPRGRRCVLDAFTSLSSNGLTARVKEALVAATLASVAIETYG